MSYHVPEFLEVLDTWYICMEKAVHLESVWAKERGVSERKVDMKSEQRTAWETPDFQAH